MPTPVTPGVTRLLSGHKASRIGLKHFQGQLSCPNVSAGSPDQKVVPTKAPLQRCVNSPRSSAADFRDNSQMRSNDESPPAFFNSRLRLRACANACWPDERPRKKVLELACGLGHTKCAYANSKPQRTGLILNLSGAILQLFLEDQAGGAQTTSGSTGGLPPSVSGFGTVCLQVCRPWRTLKKALQKRGRTKARQAELEPKTHSGREWRSQGSLSRPEKTQRFKLQACGPSSASNLFWALPAAVCPDSD